MSQALRRALGESQADLELLASHLGLIQAVLDASDQALSVDELCARLANAFVTELGFEEVFVFVGAEPDALRVAGRYGQTERFGGPPTPMPPALPNLAHLVVREAALIRWGGGGVGPRRRRPESLEGSVVGLPLASRGIALGALLGIDVAPRRWTLAAQRALEVVGGIVGRIVGTAQARLALGALHRELEVELSAASARLARQEESLREHAGRIHELNTSLAKATRVRDTFLGSLSHDLRTPVAAITGYAAMLCEGGAGPTTPEQRRTLARIEANGRQLGRLLDDLLFLTEAESARIEPRFQPVEVGRIVEEIASSLPRLQEPGGPSLQVSIERAAARTETDPRLLGRALFHLLDHVSAASAGDVRIEVGSDAEAIRIGLDGGRTDGDGDGDAAAAPAAEEKPATADHRIGAGIGLGLVRLCIALLGGRYTVAAKADGRTSAEIWLPTRGEDPGEMPAQRRSMRRRGGDAKRSSRMPEAASGRTRGSARGAGPLAHLAQLARRSGTR